MLGRRIAVEQIAAQWFVPTECRDSDQQADVQKLAGQNQGTIIW